jgi:hypothetical protein
MGQQQAVLSSLCDTARWLGCMLHEKLVVTELGW